MRNLFNRFLVSLALKLNYIFRAKNLVQPPITLENGMPNQAWLEWYERRFLFTREYTLLAYQALTAKIEDPAFFVDRERWTEEFVKDLFIKQGGVELSEEKVIEATRITVGDILVRASRAMQTEEPKIFNPTETLINIDWVHWYTDLTGGTFYRSWMFAIKCGAAKGKLVCKLYLPA